MNPFLKSNQGSGQPNCLKVANNWSKRKFAEGCDAVFEGRDMGTVVFPKADFKFFLTASSDVRAERRYKQILSKDPSFIDKVTVEEIKRDIEQRDTRDSSREHSPLRKASNAHEIDTSDLSPEEVEDLMLSIIKSSAR